MALFPPVLLIQEGKVGVGFGTPDVPEPSTSSSSSSSTSTTFEVEKLFNFFDYAFIIDLQDAYLCVPIVKHHHHFLCFVWCNVPYQRKILPFGLATAPRLFTYLTKPIFAYVDFSFCLTSYILRFL